MAAPGPVAPAFAAIPWAALAPFADDDDNWLGDGASCDVFKGTWLGQKVAIKVLRIPRKGPLRAAASAAFQSELGHLARATGSPFLPRLFGACVPSPDDPPGAKPALVMELAEGGTLAEKLYPHGIHPTAAAADAPGSAALALDESAAVQIFVDVARGLIFLHGTLRTAHLDVKPPNVLLRRDGSALISDFGIAKIKEVTTLGGGGGTSAGSLAGTARYMAPEQW